MAFHLSILFHFHGLLCGVNQLEIAKTSILY
jgi:hypothetical protein